MTEHCYAWSSLPRRVVHGLRHIGRHRMNHAPTHVRHLVPVACRKSLTLKQAMLAGAWAVSSGVGAATSVGAGYLAAGAYYGWGSGGAGGVDHGYAGRPHEHPVVAALPSAGLVTLTLVSQPVPTVATTPTSVPEPSTLSLVLASVTTLGLIMGGLRLLVRRP